MASRTSTNRPARFRMEQLETRQMMAGDVAAVVTAGNLYLSEGGQLSGDNGVLISQLENGLIRVQGTDANQAGGAKSLINGKAY
jgi:hypothetical protein